MLLELGYMWIVVSDLPFFCLFSDTVLHFLNF